MVSRNLEITVLQAKDLKNVNFFPFKKMKVYVVVSINGDNRTAQETPVDKKGGSNPVWNHTMTFTSNEADLHRNLLYIESHLISSRKVLGDKEIGSAEVPVKELFDRNNSGEENASCRVWLSNGMAKGVLDFSYKFGDKFNNNSVLQQQSSPWVGATVYHPPPQPPPPPPPGSGVYQGVMGGLAGQLASKILIDAVATGVADEIVDALGFDF